MNRHERRKAEKLQTRQEALSARLTKEAQKINSDPVIVADLLSELAVISEIGSGQ